jgi:hypothetical protein
MYKIIGADGREYGPVTTDQLKKWITEGRVTTQTRAQAEGASDWKLLGDFPEFAAMTGMPVSVNLPSHAASEPRPGVNVSNYLVPAILCTVFCCMPLGIAAIVFAAQANSKAAVGDLTGAWESANRAKKFCWISFWLAIVPIVLYILVIAVVGIAAR